MSSLTVADVILCPSQKHSSSRKVGYICKGHPTMRLLTRDPTRYVPLGAVGLTARPPTSNG
jgi:hypothetical protein